MIENKLESVEKKSEKVRLNLYLSKRNRQLLDIEKDRTGQSIAEIVDVILDQYFRQTVDGRNSLLGADLATKIDKIINKLDNIQAATNGAYRSSTYTSEMISALNDNQDLKRIARKKTMKNYSALRQSKLTKEDFLEEVYEENEPEVLDRIFKPSEEPQEKPSEVLNENPSQTSSSPINLSKYLGNK